MNIISIISFLIILTRTNSLYSSKFTFTQLGNEFQAKDNVQLLSISTVSSRLRCSAACNQNPSCHTFDYESISGRCRLFQGDLTTGSIISSTYPNSIVGMVTLSSSLFTSIYNNKSCDLCTENRYQTCSNTSSKCQCNSNTYWNGSICLLQLFENSTCSDIDACRHDLNLSCSINCYSLFTICSKGVNTTTRSNVSTVVGSCNGLCNETLSGNLTTLHQQAGIFVDNNKRLYVADSIPVNTLLVFEENQQTAQRLVTFGAWPTYIYVNNDTSNIYVTILNLNYFHVFPANVTIPKNSTSSSCVLDKLQGPTDLLVDSQNNIYVSSFTCHWVTKWTLNATSGTVVAGSLMASSGNTSQLLNLPYGLALDESTSTLYVSDRNNHRIQKFVLGNTTAETVAGGNGAGSAANQLNRPTTIALSKIDGALYICDNTNHRVQKWAQGASSGTTVAGNSNAVPGNSLYSLRSPYDIWLDPNDEYILISDTSNCRVQKYFLN